MDQQASSNPSQGASKEEVDDIENQLKRNDPSVAAYPFLDSGYMGQAPYYLSPNLDAQPVPGPILYDDFRQQAYRDIVERDEDEDDEEKYDEKENDAENDNEDDNEDLDRLHELSRQQEHAPMLEKSPILEKIPQLPIADVASSIDLCNGERESNNPDAVLNLSDFDTNKIDPLLLALTIIPQQPESVVEEQIPESSVHASNNHLDDSQISKVGADVQAKANSEAREYAKATADAKGRDDAKAKAEAKAEAKAKDDSVFRSSLRHHFRALLSQSSLSIQHKIVAEHEAEIERHGHCVPSSLGHCIWVDEVHGGNLHRYSFTLGEPIQAFVLQSSRQMEHRLERHRGWEAVLNPEGFKYRAADTEDDPTHFPFEWAANPGSSSPTHQPAPERQRVRARIPDSSHQPSSRQDAHQNSSTSAHGGYPVQRGQFSLEQSSQSMLNRGFPMPAFRGTTPTQSGLVHTNQWQPPPQILDPARRQVSNQALSQVSDLFPTRSHQSSAPQTSYQSAPHLNSVAAIGSSRLASPQFSSFVPFQASSQTPSQQHRNQVLLDQSRPTFDLYQSLSSFPAVIPGSQSNLLVQDPSTSKFPDPNIPVVFQARGRACGVDGCRRQHTPWPPSGDLLVEPCGRRCEICGELLRAANTLRGHVKSKHQLGSTRFSDYAKVYTDAYARLGYKLKQEAAVAGGPSDNAFVVQAESSTFEDSDLPSARQ